MTFEEAEILLDESRHLIGEEHNGLTIQEILIVPFPVDYDSLTADLLRLKDLEPYMPDTTYPDYVFMAVHDLENWSIGSPLPVQELPYLPKP
ncbi:hypothetical protein ABDD95_03765 [Mucilaginibacter sp. PAMB04274]|uniref:hypothetical protein n=1 Tax=Mucilaginibacter sp. PAMB04274 TaxID=3138568 RepID=UPI0031F709DD